MISINVDKLHLTSGININTSEEKKHKDKDYENNDKTIASFVSIKRGK